MCCAHSSINNAHVCTHVDNPQAHTAHAGGHAHTLAPMYVDRMCKQAHARTDVHMHVHICSTSSRGCVLVHTRTHLHTDKGTPARRHAHRPSSCTITRAHVLPKSFSFRELCPRDAQLLLFTHPHPPAFSEPGSAPGPVPWVRIQSESHEPWSGPGGGARELCEPLWGDGRSLSQNVGTCPGLQATQTLAGRDQDGPSADPCTEGPGTATLGTSGVHQASHHLEAPSSPVQSAGLGGSLETGTPGSHGTQPRLPRLLTRPHVSPDKHLLDISCPAPARLRQQCENVAGGGWVCASLRVRAHECAPGV